jgi:hypothetical protein
MSASAHKQQALNPATLRAVNQLFNPNRTIPDYKEHVTPLLVRMLGEVGILPPGESEKPIQRLKTSLHLSEQEDKKARRKKAKRGNPFYEALTQFFYCFGSLMLCLQLANLKRSSINALAAPGCSASDAKRIYNQEVPPQTHALIDKFCFTVARNITALLLSHDALQLSDDANRGQLTGVAQQTLHLSLQASVINFRQRKAMFGVIAAFNLKHNTGAGIDRHHHVKQLDSIRPNLQGLSMAAGLALSDRSIGDILGSMQKTTVTPSQRIEACASYFLNSFKRLLILVPVLLGVLAAAGIDIIPLEVIQQYSSMYTMMVCVIVFNICMSIFRNVVKRSQGEQSLVEFKIEQQIKLGQTFRLSNFKPEENPNHQVFVINPGEQLLSLEMQRLLCKKYERLARRQEQPVTQRKLKRRDMATTANGCGGGEKETVVPASDAELKLAPNQYAHHNRDGIVTAIITLAAVTTQLGKGTFTHEQMHALLKRDRYGLHRTTNPKNSEYGSHKIKPSGLACRLILRARQASASGIPMYEVSAVRPRHL